MQDKQFKLKVSFFKKRDMIYLSQLDIYRFLLRALRRSGLPLFYTQGFNPHPKISMYKALKLGEEGEVEVVFYFRKPLSRKDFLDSFSKELPQDLEIREVKVIEEIKRN